MSEQQRTRAAESEIQCFDNNNWLCCAFHSRRLKINCCKLSARAICWFVFSARTVFARARSWSDIVVDHEAFELIENQWRRENANLIETTRHRFGLSALIRWLITGCALPQLLPQLAWWLRPPEGALEVISKKCRLINLSQTLTQS